MNELSLFDNEQSIVLALSKPSNELSAEKRRRMVMQLPVIQNLPDTLEKRVFFSSCNVTIAETEINELGAKINALFKGIAHNVGYTIRDDREWKQLMVSLIDILLKYYKYFTLTDIKMAFELFVIGELNAYISERDRKHYDSFSIDYITRVLNAYKNVRNKAVDYTDNIVAQLPKPKDENKENEYAKKKTREAFDYYKEHGKLPDNPLACLWHVYRYLQLHGMVGNIEVTAEDKNKAFLAFRKRYAMGMENQDKGAYILHQGIEGEENKENAKEYSRNREIEKTFDKLIKKQ